MARVVLNQKAVQLAASRPARQLVAQTTAAVNRQARDNAPGGEYSTGRLKASINWRITYDNFKDGVTADSGSELPYAWLVHQGVQPHEILPVRASHLRFYWRRIGRRVRLLRVSHPGQRAQPYLTSALLEIAPRHGFKVIIY